MKIIPGNLSQNKWGQIYAFIIAMSFLFTAGILIWLGHETSGTILGSINIIALASLFIYGKREQSGVTSKGISSVVLA